MRETVKGVRVFEGLGWGEVGARRSLRVPVSSRARVEVKATMDTFVAGELEGGMETEGGYRVWIIVPRLLMKASPGPVVRKKPAVRSHIVGSVRKMRVSVFKSMVFLRAVSESRGLEAKEEASVSR